MTRKPGLTYGEAFPIGGRMMAMDARLRARDAHDPHKDLMELLTEKLNNPDDIATAGLMVKRMLEFYVKKERDGDADAEDEGGPAERFVQQARDNALRKRVTDGLARSQTASDRSLNAKFPGLGRIGQA